MKLTYIASLSISSLKRRKLRSFLTIGGMMIGVAVIVFLVSLGFGLQKIIRERVANVDALTILDVSTGSSALLDINEELVERFRGIEHVVGVSPSMSVSGQVLKEGQATDIAIFGVNPSQLAIEGLRINLGKPFTGEDVKETVLTTTAAELLGYKNPTEAIGQRVMFRLLVQTFTEGDTTAETTVAQNTNASDANVNTAVLATNTNTGSVTTNESVITKEIEVEVVGITEEAELSIGYLPVNILLGIGIKNFNLAKVKVDEQSHLQDIRTVIEAEGYQVDSVADTIGQIDQIFLVFEIVMGILGFIAMFIASLGAFNTLTVSLLERTREVGIMRALGALRKDVYRLFLLEAVVIGITGGVLGILFGWLSGQVANIALNMLADRFGGEHMTVFYTPLFFIAFILVLSFVASFITGFYPARRAAKINPLDALRYE